MIYNLCNNTPGSAPSSVLHVAADSYGPLLVSASSNPSVSTFAPNVQVAPSYHHHQVPPLYGSSQSTNFSESHSNPQHHPYSNSPGDYPAPVGSYYPHHVATGAQQHHTHSSTESPENNGLGVDYLDYHGASNVYHPASSYYNNVYNVPEQSSNGPSPTLPEPYTVASSNTAVTNSTSMACYPGSQQQQQFAPIDCFSGNNHHHGDLGDPLGHFSGGGQGVYSSNSSVSNSSSVNNGSGCASSNNIASVGGSGPMYYSHHHMHPGKEGVVYPHFQMGAGMNGKVGSNNNSGSGGNNNNNNNASNVPTYKWMQVKRNLPKPVVPGELWPYFGLRS